MTTREFVANLRKLLDSPEHWTKEVQARRSDGSMTYATSPNAVAWCLTGGVTKLYDDPTVSFATFVEAWSTSVGVLKARTIFTHLVDFNDAPETTHTNIIQFLDAVLDTFPQEPIV